MNENNYKWRQWMIIDVELLDQRPDGRVVCTTEDNTTIAVYKIPKSMIDLCIEDVYKKSGVYFLVESKNKKVYVGKSTNNKGIINRINVKDKPHIRIKDWDWLLLVVDITATVRKVFNSDFISNLENKYWALLKSAADGYKYNVVNEGTPPKFKINNLDTLNKIIDCSSKMIYALGFEFLIQAKPFDIQNVEDKYLFELKIRNIEAKLAYDVNNRRYWLLKGSNIASKEVESCYSWISDSRKAIKKFIKNGVLNENIVYDNPSRAAGVVAGASVSGNEWKNSEGKSPLSIIKK